jgi:hypothetical protein
VELSIATGRPVGSDQEQRIVQQVAVTLDRPDHGPGVRDAAGLRYPGELRTGRLDRCGPRGVLVVEHVSGE